MRYLDVPKKTVLKNGKELIVRRPEPEDAKEIIDYLDLVGGESDNLTFGSGDMNFTEEQERSYIQKVNADENCLLLLGIADGEIVGICNIDANPKKRMAHNAEVGITVRKSHWRQGIGEALLSELIAFAQAHKTISIVALGVRACNSGAIKLYEKLGFVECGVRKDFFNLNGKYDDEILMDLHLRKKEQ
jgi:RimJ/RimL family protein N-acetyltransferase